MAPDLHPANTRPSDPSVTVIICTRNRTESLRETLASIWNQARKPKELIVIDDGDLALSVQSAIASDASAAGIEFRCNKSDARGLTRCRNQAARLAAGDVLFYLDDDVTCRRDCIQRAIELFRDPRVGGITANVEEPLFESPSAQAFQWGYRIAAWWRVAPRGKPRTPPPYILSRRHVAERACWLSGAAMALRREIVQENPFDESLVEYALGEDREMGYRLASRYWLLQSKFVRVRHRRDPGQRLDGRRLGYMTVRNYLYILRKNCQLGVGDAILIVWSFVVIMSMHAVWLAGPGRKMHLDSLRGMIAGLVHAIRDLVIPVKSKDTISTKADGKRSIHTAAMPILSPPDAAQTIRRVLFVTNRLENGGAELMLLALVQRLGPMGVQPFVLCLKDGGPLAASCRASGVPVFEGLLHHKTDAAVIPRIRQVINENRIDIVVAAHSGGDRMFWSTLAGRLTNIPVVVWSHWFPLPGQHHFERANRALYRLVDAYVAIGNRHRAALISREHVPAGRITVIPNAIALDRFLGDTSRSAARRRLRLSDDHIAIAIVANLRREKRHDIFIAAAKALAQENPSLRFLIIGDGPDRDSVQAIAASSGLDHEVLRLLGPRDDVPDLLPGIDISCLCSEQECFSVTMLEAAAAGCPFVGPDSGCMPEFLEHGVTGLLIPPANGEALVDALRKLAGDATLREALARSARRKVMAEYGVDRMVRSFADLFQSLKVRRRAIVRQSGRGGYPIARPIEKSLSSMN